MKDLSVFVAGIEYKTRRLLEELQRLQNENKALNEKLQQTESDLDETKNQLSNLTEKNQMLRLTKYIDPGEQSGDLKTKVSEMVREIDKCIGLLNK